MEAAKKLYQAFYTHSVPIVDHMVSELSLDRADLKILEPCGGNGVFVDQILKERPGVAIDVWELNPKAFETLQIKYQGYSSIKIKHSDTLLDSSILFYSSMGGKYDRIIANPPYGAWQDMLKYKPF